MVRSVAREFHWPPKLMGGLFVDEEDYESLEFWYNDIVKVAEDLKSKMPKTPGK